MNKEEKTLQHRNINPTAMRLLVLQYLSEQKKAISLKDLEEGLFLADKSTLFRTLKTFEEKKLIHSIDDGTGAVKYALCYENCNCAPEDIHYHFHCTKCDNTFCLDSVRAPSIELPRGFELKQANLVIKGICAYCNP
ncbi:MAG: transcriptional repressor [Bacteroidetes bacterium]|nr:MAG: transcriptional repressor [Bacteroidota bacterium]